MRLVDNDEVIRIVREEVKDEDNTLPVQFRAGVDYVLKIIDELPIVKAIPVEWIEKWFSQFYGEQGLEWNRCKRFMLEDWEKENES